MRERDTPHGREGREREGLGSEILRTRARRRGRPSRPGDLNFDQLAINLHTAQLSHRRARFLGRLILHEGEIEAVLLRLFLHVHVHQPAVRREELPQVLRAQVGAQVTDEEPRRLALARPSASAGSAARGPEGGGRGGRVEWVSVYEGERRHKERQE